mmetsp:Transcript_17081/g.59917  ORF Transcript_17081/g.59917 Transcript_17081/m.59917 type:complete len:277 (-) Transcript_17081:275-1105(-)
MNVWRCSIGGISSSSTMRRIWGSKPMSSMRSASSSTRCTTLRRLTRPRSTRSTRRPGVATTMSQPRSSSRICVRMSAPPYTTQAWMPVRYVNLRASSKICDASSRVGATMRQLGYALRRPPSGTGSAPTVIIFWMTGNRKPPVLPDPVCAHAIMSRPARPIGMAYFCTGVGRLKPHSSRLRHSTSPMWSTSNDSMHGGTSSPDVSTGMSSYLSKLMPALVPARSSPKRSRSRYGSSSSEPWKPRRFVRGPPREKRPPPPRPMRRSRARAPRAPPGP